MTTQQIREALDRNFKRNDSISRVYYYKKIKITIGSYLMWSRAITIHTYDLPGGFIVNLQIL